MKLGRAPVGDAAAAFNDAGRPPAETPWLQASWCAVDLELTGLDPRRDEIIALGVVPIEEGRVVLGEARYALARASERPSEGAVKVHKLRLADVADAPPVSAAIDLLLESLAGRVPVFHAAFVESAFLGPQLSARRLRLPPAVDTEVLARRWLEQRDGAAPEWVSLARLAHELGQRAELPHHALGDALTTAQAFIALACHLDQRAPQTIESLIKGSVADGASATFRGRSSL